MNRNIALLLVCLLCTSVYNLSAQQYLLKGTVSNAKLEPLSFVTVQIKDLKIGTKTDEEGHYEFELEEGEYELVFSLVGYKKQSIKFVHRKNGPPQNVILEESTSQIDEVKIVSFRKDKAEEIIRNVIKEKKKITEAYNSYSTEVYIRATEENNKSLSEKQLKRLSDSARTAMENALPEMSMTEVYLKVDYAYPDKIKEQRTGIKVRGDQSSLFFLTTTDGDFSLYNNLIKIPALSETPMLSPISYSGLIAYKYKTKSIFKRDKYTIYTIHFSPTRMGNALVEGDVRIVDTSWSILSCTYQFPAYHMAEYDFFEVKQDHGFIDGKAWLPKRQEFNYHSKEGRDKKSGRTVAIYDHYTIDTQFNKRYFNREVSSTTLEAYQKDSTFWNTVRKEPLNENEVKFIIKSDSTYRATHSKTYLDSIDKARNRITLLKIAFLGVENYKRKTERTISINPLLSMFRPLVPGGTRIAVGGSWYRIFESKKFLSVDGEVSYGINNRDFMGDIRASYRYNPFSNGYIAASAGRSFDFIFMGDAYINLLRRSNFYIKNAFSLEHGVELVNGLIMRNRVEFAERQSLGSLKLNRQYDSIFKFNNDPIQFNPYNAFYASITLEYTPFSMYIREPRQKILLGSKFPTAYVTWRKGIPDVYQSAVNFDYVEFGLFQKIKLGLAGISQYRIFSGEFTMRKELPYIDYKFISRGNPGLFNNPLLSFQSLDSTFPIFRRFYEAHYIHRFNGSIINKIPLIKELKLLEVAGGGLLLVPERKLRYAEAYVGLEKTFRLFRERFKFGLYYVGSIANKYNRPLQLKFGIDVFDKRANTWH